MLEQEAINQLLPEIAMAHYPTKVIMHLEPVKTGVGLPKFSPELMH